jgi:hypothetical protein
VSNLRKRDNLGDPGIAGRIILRCTVKTWGGGHGQDRSGSGYGQVAGACDCGSERSDSITCGAFID